MPDEEKQELRELITDKFAELNQRIDLLVPDGDAEGHRRYHEALIEAQKRRAKIYDAIIEKTLSALIWAAIVGLAIMAWHFAGDVIKKAMGQ